LPIFLMAEKSRLSPLQYFQFALHYEIRWRFNFHFSDFSVDGRPSWKSWRPVWQGFSMTFGRVPNSEINAIVDTGLAGFSKACVPVRHEDVSEPLFNHDQWVHHWSNSNPGCKI
jgi:hypothetical protein